MYARLPGPLPFFQLTRQATGTLTSKSWTTSLLSASIRRTRTVDTHVRS